MGSSRTKTIRLKSFFTTGKPRDNLNIVCLPLLCSVYESDINAADLGTEVEYTATVKGSKLSAEHVRKLPSGTLLRETVLPDQFTGVITRSVRCLNPEQDGYPGFVKTSGGVGDTVTNGALEEYEFGITGLADIHDFVQKGDEVTFQVGICKKTGQKRAVNIKPVRSKHRVSFISYKRFPFTNFHYNSRRLSMQ